MGNQDEVKSETKRILNRINVEVYHLHLVRAEHRELFGTGDERLKILNEVSPHFFEEFRYYSSVIL